VWAVRISSPAPAFHSSTLTISEKITGRNYSRLARPTQVATFCSLALKWCGGLRGVFMRAMLYGSTLLVVCVICLAPISASSQINFDGLAFSICKKITANTARLKCFDEIGAKQDRRTGKRRRCPHLQRGTFKRISHRSMTRPRQRLRWLGRTDRFF
jgi:hypothetical protein